MTDNRFSVLQHYNAMTRGYKHKCGDASLMLISIFNIRDIANNFLMVPNRKTWCKILQMMIDKFKKSEVTNLSANFSIICSVTVNSFGHFFHISLMHRDL